MCTCCSCISITITSLNRLTRDCLNLLCILLFSSVSGWQKQAHASDITDEEEEESIAGRSLNDDDSSIGIETEESDRAHATPMNGDISTASAMAINSLFDTELVRMIEFHRFL